MMSRARTVIQMRAAARPWTPVEHNKFLFGLRLYGRGKWAKIAKKCVLTRTPTQVASHAQKYFIKVEKKLNIKVPKITRDYESQRWWQELAL